MIKPLTKLLTKLTTCCIFIFAAGTAQADSFFDVFFDVSFDKTSQTPRLTAEGHIVTFGDGVRKVETEILSMSSSSFATDDRGSKQYHATVGVRSWMINSDGKREKVDSFFDIIFACSMGADGDSGCKIIRGNPKKKQTHRGHVTVLK